MKLVNETQKIDKIVAKFAEPMTKLNSKIDGIIKIELLFAFLQIICLILTASNVGFFEWIIMSYSLVYQ